MNVVVLTVSIPPICSRTHTRRGLHSRNHVQQQATGAFIDCHRHQQCDAKSMRCGCELRKSGLHKYVSEAAQCNVRLWRVRLTRRSRRCSTCCCKFL